MSISSIYEKFEELYHSEIENPFFDLIISFDVSPEQSIERRINCGKPPEFPWTNKRFLSHIRDFYNEKMPSLTSSKIIKLNTENRTINNVRDEVYNKIGIGLTDKNISRSEMLKDEFLDYGKKMNLSKQHSNVVSFFDIPVMYFGRECILYENNKMIHFDNSFLRKVIDRHNEKGS